MGMSVFCLRAKRNTFVIAAIATLWLCAIPTEGQAELGDQHSVEAIAAALRSPIPPQILDEARQLDDQLLATGQSQGASVYLVTDDRLRRTQDVLSRVLSAAGENPNAWVVRVLETERPTVNAYVFGGRYIYVYTGLLDKIHSDDELAFVMGHEISHSLLKHLMRRNEDITQAVASISILIGQIWSKQRQGFEAVGHGMMAGYSREDEEEADALGAVIASRAGYDPIEGAGFFSRLKRGDDETFGDARRQVEALRAQVDQTIAACNQGKQLYAYPQYRNPANYRAMMLNCGNAHAFAVRYNQEVATYNTMVQQQAASTIFSDHPSYDNRVAAISAVSDYLAGRRDLNSLAAFQQSYRVMSALRDVEGQMSAATQDETSSPSTNFASFEDGKGAPALRVCLTEVKNAYERGMISEAEFQRQCGE